jgi:hypothetical protein
MPGHFTPLSRQELEHRYGSFYNSRKKISLNESIVPESLRPLIPYAELWGIADDFEREKVVISSPPLSQEDLISLVDTFDPQLDEWLAGPEADSENPTNEYIAFTAMRMARDFI